MSAAFVAASVQPAESPGPTRFGRQLAEAALGLLLSVVQFSVAATVVATLLVALPSDSHLPTLSSVVGGTMLIFVPTVIFSLFFALVVGLPASLGLARLDRARLSLGGWVAVHYAAGWLLGGILLSLMGGMLQLGVMSSDAGSAVSTLLPNLAIVAICANAFGVAAAFGALSARLTFGHLAAAKGARS